MRCSKCGADNRETARFCDSCGTALADLGLAIAARGAPLAVSAAGERRHLTVLFCDLVGSTEIAARLDPEEWREIVADYHSAAAQPIEWFGGHVAHYFGDGVMAYFGWPEAHDNNAERAARAGLGILNNISNLNEHATGPKLSVRVGIDSGAVVVGASPSKNADVYGDTPNIAARVQAAALPDTVLITAATHRLISGLFDVEDRGTQALKGIERPIRLYELIRPSGVRGRLEAAAATRGLTPFIGREEELHLLMNRWERTLQGEGQGVLIIGEPGIGKSRLLQHFHQRIIGTPHIWAEAVAAPVFQNTPFYPVSQLFRQFLAAPIEEALDDQSARLERALELAGLKPAQASPLIAPLLNLPRPPKSSALSLSPEQQRRRLLGTLVEWVLGAGRVQPLIIAAEDLHWADPSTLELLELLVEQGAAARLLLLYTGRSEFRPRWALPSHHILIALNRLSARNVRTMVEQVAAHKTLSAATVAAVVERAGGVPLFAEELTQAMLEKGDANVSAREIPATLHDSLMARLDRLGSAREVIQIGAVIGSEFSYDLLHALHPIAQEDLRSALRQAVGADLLRRRGIEPNATYFFKHALIRDAAYEALLRSRRKELHRLVARTIDQQFSALKNEHPQLLAHQWTEAGETQPAIAEWSRAGKAARESSAFTEAAECYGHALTLVNLLPESPERDLAELELRRSCVAALQLTKGWAAPETVKAAERIALLAEKSGNLMQLGNSVAAQSFTAWAAGELAAAGALADRALELALREGRPATLAFRYLMQIMVRYWRGDLAGAEQHFTAGLKFFDDAGFRRNLLGGAIAAFYYGSHNAWALGRAEVARLRSVQMIGAVNPNNPHDIATARHFAASLHICRGEYEQAAALAAEALEISQKNQFVNEAAMERIVLGEACAWLGNCTEGIALMQQGIAGMLESGQGLGIAIQSARLAELQTRAGFLTDALHTIEHALRKDFDEPVFWPEILRIRGELRHKQKHTEIAENDFREAIVLAQRMGAKAFELRSTTSLARLLTNQGRPAEAQTMLAEIYYWFTEGFDTADLKEAKALLDALSA